MKWEQFPTTVTLSYTRKNPIVNKYARRVLQDGQILDNQTENNHKRVDAAAHKREKYNHKELVRFVF